MADEPIRVGLALIWRKHSLLISRRGPHIHLAGYWEIPGGKLEDGETPEECVVREAREELAVECEPVARRPEIRWDYVSHQVLLIPVDCRYRGGAPRPLQVRECRWAAPRQLSEYAFPPANQSLVDEIILTGAPRL